jgi:PDZ domain-containing protein
MTVRRLRYGAVLLVAALAVLGAGVSPYQRVGPGPVVQIGAPGRGSWSVPTVRVQESNWFQWAVARLRGERVIRTGAGRRGDAPDAALTEAMRVSQTRAALVASQLAAGRTPVGAAGLQATGNTGTIHDLHPGDILLAVERAEDLIPLRTETDLMAAAAGLDEARLLIAPRAPDGTLGRARFDRIPVKQLATIHTDPSAVRAVAAPLGAVRGPSAGLILTLARLDALSPGELTCGRRIAGTGGISLDGAITAVGGVTDKVRGAVTARTNVFFVPASEHSEALAAARGRAIQVIPVRTVSDATEWLTTNGGC